MSAENGTLEVSSRKRKFENDDAFEENEAKRKQSAEEAAPELLDLADEVLMEILIKLDGESLHNLGLTCTQLKRLSIDKKLWTEAAFSSKELDIWEILKRLKYLLVTTKTLKIHGNCKKENVQSRPMPNRQTFKEIIKRIVDRSPLIQNLHFTQVWFDWTKDFSISKFPSNLRTLSFDRCIMPKTNRNRRMVRTFTGIVEHMPQLQELRLEYCNFFESNDVMPFSKLQNLKILSLRGCSKLKNCVPYLSLACRFGFPRLESLDLRETNVSDGELQCLNSIKSLKELFLEYPEMEPANVESDDDDDFELFFRGPRRPTGQVPMRINPRPTVVNEQGQEFPVGPALPTASNDATSAPRTNDAPSTSTTDEAPSTSRTDDTPTLATSSPAEVELDDPPSSPENFSDSVSSSSSSGPDSPLRTIVIRANINSGPNPENGQPNEPRIQVILGDAPHASRFLQFGRNQEQRAPLSVSDRGMLGFGIPRPSIMGNLVFFGNQPADPNTYLERIILRNFRNITDTTLSHFETNAPRLVFLDVRGCPQISREAVERFKAARGACEIISNYFNEE